MALFLLLFFLSKWKYGSMSRDKGHYEKSGFFVFSGGMALGEGRAGTGGLMPESVIPMDAHDVPARQAGP